MRLATTFAIAAAAAAGCGDTATTTAPPKPVPTTAPATTAGGAPATIRTGQTNTGERKLQLTGPGDQSVTQDQTVEFGVSVDRSNFNSPVRVRVSDLPAGVTVVTQEMVIPADRDSVTVTLKAAADAPAVDDHPAKVTGEADELPEAPVAFKLDVKAKK